MNANHTLLRSTESACDIRTYASTPVHVFNYVHTHCNTESDALMPNVSALIASIEEPVSMLRVSAATLVEGT